MESRSKLYKTNGRQDSKLTQRRLAKKYDQQSKRNDKFNSHRNINNGSDIESPTLSQNKPPARKVKPTERNESLQNYRLQRNLSKLKMIQRQKVPFHTVVPSGVWLDRAKNSPRRALSTVNLDQSPVRQILMKPRSIRRSTVDKVLQHSNKKAKMAKVIKPKSVVPKRETRMFNFITPNKQDIGDVPEDLELPETPFTNHESFNQIEQSPVESEHQEIPPVISVFKFGDWNSEEKIAVTHYEENPEMNSSSATFVIGSNSVENSFTLQTAGGSMTDENRIERESAPPEMFSDYKNRLIMRIQTLLAMIDSIETGEDSGDLSDHQKLKLEQTKFLVMETEKKFDSFLCQYKSKIPQRESIIFTEEDLDNYWYLVSEEIENLKKAITDIQSSAASEEDKESFKKRECKKRRKKQEPQFNSERKRHSMRLISTGTPKRHNPSCFGCESASKLGTPKSANRKSGKKSTYFGNDQSVAAPSASSRRSGRKLF